MPLGINWYAIEEASSKYCLDTSLILKWVDQGLVRAERDGTRLMRVNADDLELKVHELTGI